MTTRRSPDPHSPRDRGGATVPRSNVQAASRWVTDASCTHTVKTRIA